MRAAVFFDVGETLVNESRLYEEWADYLDVPRLTFLGALGAAIERRQHHREAFRIFEPDLTIEELLAKREQEGRPRSSRPGTFIRMRSTVWRMCAPPATPLV